MVKFRQKDFSKVKKAYEFVKNNPTLPISTAMLGISGANYLMNKKSQKKSSEDNKTQLSAITDLTKAIHNMNGSLKTSNTLSVANSEREKLMANRRSKKSIFKKKRDRQW